MARLCSSLRRVGRRRRTAVDARPFDALACALAASTSRRQVLKLLATGIGSGLLGWFGRQTAAAPPPSRPSQLPCATNPIPFVPEWSLLRENTLCGCGAIKSLGEQRVAVL